MEVLRKINLVIGYLLLTPCVVGVFYFIKGLFEHGKTVAFLFGYFIETPIQSGIIEIIKSNPFPLHFALMAIAGAYLITANLNPKENKN